jgi:hypothetical protein
MDEYIKIRIHSQSQSRNDNVAWLQLRIKFLKTTLKEQSHEIFDLWFFSSNNTPGSSDSWDKAVLNIDSNSQRNLLRFDYKNRLHAMPHSDSTGIAA